jgi:hypothetical protein
MTKNIPLFEERDAVWPLILRSGIFRVSKDEARAVASWFETRVPRSSP